jgi:hypothetical protein
MNFKTILLAAVFALGPGLPVTTSVADDRSSSMQECRSRKYKHRKHYHRGHRHRAYVHRYHYPRRHYYSHRYYRPGYYHYHRPWGYHREVLRVRLGPLTFYRYR